MISENVSAQQAIESVYSRKMIRRWIEQKLEEDRDHGLLDWFTNASLRLNAWVNQEFSYASKNTRIEQIKDIGPYNLAMAIATSVLHKAGKKTYQEVAGHLSDRMPHEDVFDRVKTAAELIAVCSDLGLYHINRGIPSTIVTGYTLDIEVYDWIKETIPALPMLCEPIEVKDNRHCGYLLQKEPAILNKLAYHDNEIALDVLNILNAQAWELDGEVLSNEAECAKEPLDTKDKWENHFEMARSSQQMYSLVAEHGNTCWLCHQFDSRGRIYSRGYHVNLQSTEYKKAVMSFKNKEFIK